MKIIRPPRRISVERLKQIHYHIDVCHGPYGSQCANGHRYEPQVRTSDQGEQTVEKPPPVGVPCPKCGETLERGPERFVAFLYRGGLDLEAHEALGECLDVGPARSTQAEAAADARDMEDRHVGKGKRRHFLVTGIA